MKSQIDKVWKVFWTGGISNPVEVIEQITYLLFIRRLDDLHTLAENKANRTGQPIENRVFPEGKDDMGRVPRDFNDLRWSVFANWSADEMFTIVGHHVFPFLQQLGETGSSYARNMKAARFTIPTPAPLVKVVDLPTAIPMWPPTDHHRKPDPKYAPPRGRWTACDTGRPRSRNVPRHLLPLFADWLD